MSDSPALPNESELADPDHTPVGIPSPAILGNAGAEPIQPATAPQPAPTSSGRMSPTGEAHDPGIHEDPPRIASRTGSWARRRGGASKAQVAAKSMAKPPANASAITGKPTVAQPDYAGQGKLIAALGFQIAQLVGGDDFAPESGEVAALESAATNYCASKGISDIPPGWALTIVVGGYVAKRWNRPTVVAKRQSAWQSIKAWLGHRYVDSRLGKDPS